MSHTQNEELPDTPTATPSMVNIDSSDPARSAQFYAAALGWNVTYSDDNYGMVEGDGVKIGFGKVDGFQPAQWPDETAAKRSS
jgi:predicted enzyme related to lactoylglutathione lyase